MSKSICVDLTSERLMTIIHALQEETGRVEGAGGDRYGALSLKEAKQLISYLLAHTNAGEVPDNDFLAFAY